MPSFLFLRQVYSIDEVPMNEDGLILGSAIVLGFWDSESTTVDDGLCVDESDGFDIEADGDSFLALMIPSIPSPIGRSCGYKKPYRDVDKDLLAVTHEGCVW